ncbi:MAG: ABC transporter substrate-binding protein [Chlorobiales bacterium]|nr:ABC transporter substrate-binding protein [Chlorobiales bacterium]
MKNLNSIKTTVVMLAMFLLAGIFATGCSPQQKKTGDITVGVILPLTGELASYGEPMKKGIEVALEKINTDEAKNGTKINLVYIDSQADTKIAVSGLQKLISVNGARYVIGDVSSSTTLAMVPIAEQNKVFLLSPGAAAPKLKGISPFFARNYPSSTDESIASAEFIKNRLKKDKCAIVYVTNEYGLGLAEMFEKKFTELGGQISMKEPYKFEESDFRTIIAKLREAKPEVIYLAGNQKEMGKFMKQFGEAGITATIVSNISFLEPDCINIAGKAADGTIVPIINFKPEDPNTKSAHEFGVSYKAKYGEYPSFAVALGYDAMMLMANAMKEGGSDTIKGAAAIRNLKGFDGALGALSFTNGDVSVPVGFKIVKNGKAVEYN